MRLLASVTKEAGGFVAQCLDIDIASEGDTVDDALANLREAIELYLEDNPAPAMPSPIITTVDVKVA